VLKTAETFLEACKYPRSVLRSCEPVSLHMMIETSSLQVSNIRLLPSRGVPSVMTDRGAEELFEKLGIKFEREPEWIKEGQKPDFYCSGRQDFWCEVKTLGVLGDSRHLGEALDELNKRASKIALSGQGFAYVNDNLGHRTAKMVMNLAGRALKRFAQADAPKSIIALVPRDPDRSKFVRFSISTKDQSKVEFHSCVSLSGKYGTPNGMTPEPYEQMTRLRFSSGEEKEVLAGSVVKATDDFQVAIVIEPAEAPFQVLTAMLTGSARRLKIPERIRATVKEANDQFKNGLEYKAAPCLLLILQEGLDVPDEVVIKSALYGNLKYSFPKGSPYAGRMILDRNGAWTRDQNRTTSAVMHIRNGGEPLVVHNYWAHRPLRAGLLACREIAALRNGSFWQVDFSAQAGIPATRTERFHRARFQARQLLRITLARLKRPILMQ
jgi:hypothetical protein